MKERVHPLAWLIAAIVRALTGVQVRWQGGAPPSTWAESRQRIYFANHSSHLDFVVVWSALPPNVRAKTRPVAAKDYWQSGVKSYIAQRVFRAVLVERRAAAHSADHEQAVAARFAVIDELAQALGERDSLIFFPEGTRGTGEHVAEFKSGLYHLAKRRPDVELVPAYLENLNRILPKGEFLVVPLLSTLTFGAPICVEEGESKASFLERARAALCALRRKGNN